MMNLKLAATKNDLREATMIEQRRTFEQERKKRIFNARERVIGVDKQALEQQIAEKEKLAQAKAEKEQKFLEYQEHVDAIVNAKEREVHMEKHRIFNEINDFRAKFQRPEDRREYDLYDPHGKRKDLPARLSDTDPRLTVSSAQKYDLIKNCCLLKVFGMTFFYTDLTGKILQVTNVKEHKLSNKRLG